MINYNLSYETYRRESGEIARFQDSPDQNWRRGNPNNIKQMWGTILVYVV